MKIFGIKNAEPDDKITEDMIKTMLDMSLDDDEIEREEHEIISNVLDTNDLCVKDIMVPKTKVSGITEDFTYEEVVNAFKEERYSRLVVFNKNKDKVLGILHIKDLLFTDSENFDIYSLLRQPYFTCEIKKANDILNELRETQNTMAIILDEFGDLSGIVTIEDIVEEYVGQIRDEYDEEELGKIKQIATNEYEVDGDISLLDLNEALELNLESDNYTTVGGYITEKLDRLPKSGDILEDEIVIFKGIEVKDNKIESLTLEIPNSVNAETEA